MVRVSPASGGWVGEERELGVAHVEQPTHGHEPADVGVAQGVQKVHERFGAYPDARSSAGREDVASADDSAKLPGAVGLDESPGVAGGDGDGVVGDTGGGEDQIFDLHLKDPF